MSNQEIAPELIEFAMPLVERTAHKIKVRDELRNVDVEDIQQDLMLHVCERAPSFDPELGTVQAFVTQVVVNGVGMLLRKMSRQRDKPTRMLKMLSGIIEQAWRGGASRSSSAPGSASINRTSSFTVESTRSLLVSKPNDSPSETRASRIVRSFSANPTASAQAKNSASTKRFAASSGVNIVSVRRGDEVVEW